MNNRPGQDRYRREEELFEAALKLPTDEERDVFLRDACGGDASLLQEVRHLITAWQSDGGGGDNWIALELAEENICAPAPRHFEAGEWIGAFRVVETLGEGGMGAVYLAEQKAPGPRRVAVKVIRPGWVAPDTLARFDVERRALAKMNHPNIAKVFDAGSTEDGLPFFAMEFIRGLPLTEFCDVEKLDLEGRLQLFSKVCSAVHHAHQKGIIHRDLKPSNILVTKVDGEPAPKVIDFGIGKALAPGGDGPPGATKGITRANQIVGTPAYMSPEMAALSRQVDARADVYALGALLYELLTATTPHRRERLEGGDVEAILRTIREDEPHRPSVRLERMRQEERYKAAQNRGFTDPAAHGRAVRGDLDWVVMKALSKELDRRYESVEALAEDITHHLRDEPVTAADPGFFYRAKKFARRHRGPCLAAATAGAALVVAFGASTTLYHLAEEARRAEVAAGDALGRKQRAAMVARARADSVATFMLGQTHRDLASLGKLDLLAGFAERAWEHFEATHAKPGAGPAQRVRNAQRLTRLGDIFRAGGSGERAEAAYTQALENLDGARKEPGAPVARAEALTGLAHARAGRGDLDGADQLLREARNVLETTGDETRHRLAEHLRKMAEFYAAQGSVNAEVATLEAEVRAREKIAAGDGSRAASAAELAASRRHLAGTQVRARLPGAEENLRRAVADYGDLLAAATDPAPAWRLGMAGALLDLFNVPGGEDEPAAVGEATALLNRAADALAGAFNEPGPDLERRRLRLRIIAARGRAWESAGEWSAAADDFRAAVVEAGELGRRSPEEEVWEVDRTRASHLLDLARAEAGGGHEDAARTAANEGAALVEQLLREHPDEPGLIALQGRFLEALRTRPGGGPEDRL